MINLYSITGKQWQLPEATTTTLLELQQMLAGKHAQAIQNAWYWSEVCPTIQSIDDMRDILHTKDFLGHQIAIERITQAIKTWERLLVCGDYDVDGVCASSIAVRVLRDLGADVSVRIPDRALHGYGVHESFVDEAKEANASLILTVDCGSRDHDVLKKAKSRGIDVIVTDHHHLWDTTPEVLALINPQALHQTHPLRVVCGTVVVWALLWDLVESLQKDGWTKASSIDMQQYIDQAMIATIADCMPVAHPLNTYIVKRWLATMPCSASAFLRYAYHSLAVPGTAYTAEDIAFGLAPRLNAAGRMSHATVTLRAILARTTAQGKIGYEELSSLNEQRKHTTKLHLQQALEQYHAKKHVEQWAHPTSKDIIIYASRTLPHGIAGIVAGQLASQFGLPAIAMTYEEATKNATIPDKNGYWVGSCRAPDGVSIIDICDGSPLHSVVRPPCSCGLSTARLSLPAVAYRCTSKCP
jgi:single-stranded-DNA-specific exonuclease